MCALCVCWKLLKPRGISWSFFFFVPFSSILSLMLKFIYWILFKNSKVFGLFVCLRCVRDSMKSTYKGWTKGFHFNFFMNMRKMTQMSNRNVFLINMCVDSRLFYWYIWVFLSFCLVAPRVQTYICVGCGTLPRVKRYKWNPYDVINYPRFFTET